MPALGLLGCLAACGATTNPCEVANPCGPTCAVVERAVDGDTIVLTTGEKIRYLLVDTTETTNGHNDCYGQEAADFNRGLVEGKNVTLKYDTQCTDRYGRLLAYVSVDGKEVNTALVEQGYACVLYIPPDGMARHQEFLDLQSVAKTNKTGIWGACAVVTCG